MIGVHATVNVWRNLICWMEPQKKGYQVVLMKIYYNPPSAMWFLGQGCFNCLGLCVMVIPGKEARWRLFIVSEPWLHCHVSAKSSICKESQSLSINRIKGTQIRREKYRTVARWTCELIEVCQGTLDVGLEYHGELWKSLIGGESHRIGFRCGLLKEII